MDNAVTVIGVIAMLFAGFAVGAHGAAVALLGLDLGHLLRPHATVRAVRGRPDPAENSGDGGPEGFREA